MTYNLRLRNVLIVLLLFAFRLSLFAVNVEPGKAKKVAVNFFYQHNLRVQVSDMSVYRIKSDTIYYIFNLNPSGFIIISAEDNVYPVLGYKHQEGNPNI